MVLDPITILETILDGDVFQGLVLIYTGTFGDLFWGVLFFMASAGLYIRTKSVGLLMGFGMVFSFALIGSNLLPFEFHIYASVVMALCIAGMFYWMFAGREQ